MRHKLISKNATILGCLSIVISGCSFVNSNSSNHNYYALPQTFPEMEDNVTIAFATGDGQIIAKGITETGKESALIKSNQSACENAFGEALAKLGKRANALQANKIINIVSGEVTAPFRSSRMYECEQGKFSNSVKLTADLAK